MAVDRMYFMTITGYYTMHAYNNMIVQSEVRNGHMQEYRQILW
jgi:hypothetical protein